MSGDLYDLRLIPMRLQLRRVKGYDLQALSTWLNGRTAVNCARPGRWGNPFKVDRFDRPITPKLAVQLYRAQLMGSGWVADDRGRVLCRIGDVREKLRGHNLACFCPLDAPYCHVNTLLEVANS